MKLQLRSKVEQTCYPEQCNLINYKVFTTKTEMLPNCLHFAATVYLSIYLSACVCVYGCNEVVSVQNVHTENLRSDHRRASVQKLREIYDTMRV